MNMTFEQALQKVAERYGYENYHDAAMDYFFTGIPDISALNTEAATLWNQSLIDRIKELEEGLKELVTQCDSLDYGNYPNTYQAKQLLSNG